MEEVPAVEEFGDKMDDVLISVSGHGLNNMEIQGGLNWVKIMLIKGVEKPTVPAGTSPVVESVVLSLDEVCKEYSSRVSLLEMVGIIDSLMFANLARSVIPGFDEDVY